MIPAEHPSTVDHALQLIAETAGRVLGADRVTVTLADDGGCFRARAAWGGPPDAWRDLVLAPGEGITGRVLAAGDTVVLEGIDAPEIAAQLPGVRVDGGRVALGAPIVLAERPLGVLIVVWKRDQAVGAPQRQLAETLAHHVATVLENARMAERERSLRELAQALAAHLDEGTVLDLAVQHAARLLGAPFARVWLSGPDGSLTRAAAFGAGALEPDRAHMPPTSVAALVAQGAVVNLGDASAHPAWADRRFFEESHLRAYLGAPIRRAGEALGVLAVMREPERPFGADDEALLVAIADAVAVAVANARLYRAAQRSQEWALQTAKMQALGQMASGIAHDLNQALGLVVGHGELALQHLDPPRRWPGGGSPPSDLDSARDSIRVMVKAAMDGADTVKRLLAFSRAQPEGEAELVELGALLADVAKLTAPRWRDDAQAEGRRIWLTVEVDGDTTVAGWPASLRETLANLVFNAVDALPGGGTIRLRAGRESDRVFVEVTDDGVGMPPDVQARVFEPFFTTKGEKGTGLGLAVVFGIVERHGGAISVESRTSGPARGTTFRIALPAAEMAAAQPAPVEPEAESGASRMRILAVDDEPELREMIAMMLDNDGHEVTTAGGGEEALAALASERFDVLISDVGMPGMTGWELAERVRARWPALRLVLATGWGAEIDPDEARQRGIEAVIAKPFRFADLRRVLLPTG